MEELNLFVKFNMEAKRVLHVHKKMYMYNHVQSCILKVEQLHVIASSLPNGLESTGPNSTVEKD